MCFSCVGEELYKLSARTGESSKVNSLQTISGISLRPGNFFTFKACGSYSLYAPRHTGAQAPAQMLVRGSKGRKWAVRLPRNSLNSIASVASSRISLPISWDHQSPEPERPPSSLMSFHHREIFMYCRPDTLFSKKRFLHLEHASWTLFQSGL